MSTTTEQAPPRPGTWVLKVAMAITGTLLVAFLLIHLFGNFKIFTGPEHFDDYAEWLRVAFAPFLPEGMVLWLFRIVIFGGLFIHVYGAITIWSRGRKARGPHRAGIKASRTGFQGFSARLMPVTGVFTLAFIVIHLMDLTLGIKPVASDSFQHPVGTRPAAYSNVIASFERPWMAAIYIIMMVLISIHVAHGVTTVVQDLGAMGKRVRLVAAIVAGLCALAILLGNAAIPLAVQFGVIS
ncbi:succinate dehydrogenase cytochrome b subunit [Ancrocorticia populi]|uniref:Succinate dehydrogenase n=1 Tax=Ancrocorticia populi TaxID=2175228 RepID=A0A2V1KC19_9ACTO|nr:succinate dehydrogenase cytochrome b subunit [Ancrocorticia populi]MDN6486546.1 succinate dehydrogenase cytochrome b subunit [Ancrocorticia sp.]PWF26480.1 succinate dehydrogenase [Ancrocorticia populi]